MGTTFISSFFVKSLGVYQKNAQFLICPASTGKRHGGMYLPVQAGNSEGPVVNRPEIAIALYHVYRYDYR
jgi:hypothetical protein